ncbi:MAG TPA: hybrid sensor histidine kinase/response regulator [Vicinamibacterales bacterium]|nr:hybrid sensor histidine kinase/response regulator [Vicinamibacterales bacterium]
MSSDDLDGLSMLDLFRMEAESQTQAVTSALLVLEGNPAAADQLELCMRSAHSLKGAARIVDLTVAVRVAHVMEDCFVAAQHGSIVLTQSYVDTLLGANDLLRRIANTPEQDQGQWADEAASGVGACLSSLALILVGASDAFASGGEAAPPGAVQTDTPARPVATPPGGPPADPPTATHPAAREASDRVLRVTAENLNRLLGLAGESLVQARWVKPFAESLLRLKRSQHECCTALDALRDAFSEAKADPALQAALDQAYHAAFASEEVLGQRLLELEMFDRRSLNVSHRMYREALACRMRPFADGVQAFPRMVRDLARTLGKEATLEVIGDSTQVDRDILAKLDAPLGHLLRNAVDHGLEMPEQRQAAGKPARGVVRLEARHSAGALQVIVSEDGRGVDVAKTRAAVIERNLLNQEAADRLSDAEVLEFLFLPGFSMKGTVTDISGRGVGLDVVQDMVKQVRGTVRVSTEPGRGTRFVLQLPVTLSVVRTLLAEIGGEPYAFPLACIVRALKLPKDRIAMLEGRQHFELDGQRIGLLRAHQVLGVDESADTGAELPVIVIGDHGRAYGLVVDRLLGERELVVQPLDRQLGKVRDIAAGALMDDGSPVLIIDPEDLLRSADKLISEGRPTGVAQDSAVVTGKKRKQVLVVDDSLTVRELERKLLVNHGYEVKVAVDGMDGWNAARAGDFDLVVTDIDMPRMDGIELVTLINSDARLKTRPVIVVSYKDREEDRRRGLEAGAAYYLTKGSFNDETLVQAVVDLIGEAGA